MRRARLRILVVLALAAGSLAVAPSGRADDGPGKDDRVEVRREGRCSAASRWKLRLRAEDGRIRVEFEVDTRRNGASWAVVLLHERRLVSSVRLRTEPPSGSLELRRSVGDWFGTDAIVARATGPSLETCRAAVMI
jgi:hypothetical protein